MKRFKSVVREIIFTLDGILILPLILNAVIIFLLVFLIMILFDWTPIPAYAIATLYLALAGYYKMKISKVRLIELVYPDLDERLRTAADHAGEDGEIVDELHK